MSPRMAGSSRSVTVAPSCRARLASEAGRAPRDEPPLCMIMPGTIALCVVRTAVLDPNLRNSNTAVNGLGRRGRAAGQGGGPGTAGSQRNAVTDLPPQRPRGLLRLSERAWQEHDDEIAADMGARLARHRPGGIADGYQLVHGHRQAGLVRLVGRADRIVAAGRAAHLDVAAEHVRDLPGPGEGHQPVQAFRERGLVADVEPPRVDRVAGDQEPGPRVIDG